MEQYYIITNIKAMSNIKTYPNNDILNESFVIYQIENDIIKDAYVGYTTVKLKTRYANHNGCHSNSKKSNSKNRTTLYLDFKKYGKENFTMSILAKCNTKDELISKEKEYQKQTKYIKYNRNLLKRDTRSGKNKGKVIQLTDSDGNVLLFNKPIEVAKKFNVHRSSILKAISNNYRFLRKYNAKFITIK